MNGVLVGVDGSPGADRAAAEAASMRAPLTICYVRPPAGVAPPVLSRHQVGEVLRATELVTAQWPVLTVHRIIVDGYPGTQLRQLTRQYEVAVIGSQGRSHLTGTTIGAVTRP